MSVHIASLANPKRLLEQYPGYQFAAFTAGVAREIGCFVMRAPTPEDPSHAVVVRADNPGARLTGGQALRFKNAAVLVNC